MDDTGVYHVPQKCTSGCTYVDDEASDSGPTDLQEALTKSDDYYFYSLGDQFYYSSNPDGIQKTAAEYGLGEPTGIDLPGDYYGQVDSASLRAAQHKADPSVPASYYVGDNIETAFGQGETTVTPIQQAVAYATFANGGTRYQPQVAAAVVGPTGKVVKQFAPKVTGTVSLPASTYQPMLAGFEGVVSSQRRHRQRCVRPVRQVPHGELSHRGQDGNRRCRADQGTELMVRRIRTDQPCGE